MRACPACHVLTQSTVHGSIALLAPHLSDEAKETPYWKAWVAHARVLEMALRSSFSLADVTRLDELIVVHHALFLKVSISMCYTMCSSTCYTVCFSMCYTADCCCRSSRSKSTTGCGSRSTTSRRTCPSICCVLDHCGGFGACHLRDSTRSSRKPPNYRTTETRMCLCSNIGT